jgi:hypothetical protein
MRCIVLDLGAFFLCFCDVQINRHQLLLQRGDEQLLAAVMLNRSREVFCCLLSFGVGCFLALYIAPSDSLCISGGGVRFSLSSFCHVFLIALADLLQPGLDTDALFVEFHLVGFPGRHAAEVARSQALTVRQCLKAIDLLIQEVDLKTSRVDASFVVVDFIQHNLLSALLDLHAWLAERGGAGNFEGDAILARLRQVIERFGESRFTRWESAAAKIDEHGPRTIDRLGFRKTMEHGMGDALHTTNTYYVLPEAWRSEIFRGMNLSAVNKELLRRGVLEPGKDGKASTAVRLPGLGLQRCYVVVAVPEQGDHGAQAA